MYDRGVDCGVDEVCMLQLLRFGIELAPHLRRSPHYTFTAAYIDVEYR
jgi:hypothetical protein